MTDLTLTDYQQKMAKLVEDLSPIFAQSSTGDFSAQVPFPETEDEFTSIYAGVKIIMDVVREKMTELEARMQEKEQLLSSLGDGVVTINPEGKISYANPSAAKILRRSTTELLNLPWSTICPSHLLHKPDQSPTSTQPLMQNPTLYYLYPDGGQFPVMETITEIQNPTQTVIVFRDITKEKEIDLLKSDFLAVAAHQLRTPLSNIRWNLEFLLKNLQTNLPPDVKSKLETVYEDNLMLINLVNDILSITKLSQGMIDQSTEPTNIKTVIDKVIAEMKPEIDRKHLMLNYHTHNGDLNEVSLKLDPSHLYQVIQNLISNAIKYSAQNQTITVTLYIENNAVHVAVQDQGIGIPEAEQADVFNRFYRASNAVNAGTSGSGLGLFVAKAFIESWHGKIWLESKEGQGTKITFYIPIEK